MGLMSPAVAEEPVKSAIQWKQDKGMPAIPDEFGFAGGYAGIVGEGDGRMLVFGGGANFPNKDPFESGVAKTWHDSLFAIRIAEEGLAPAEGAQWERLSVTLPEKMGYGASVSLPHHKTALFIGGSVAPDGGKKTSGVYELAADGKSVKIAKVGDLPVAVGNISAAIIGKRVYVFSGNSEKGSVAKSWVMDTSDSDRVKWKWTEMPWPKYEKGKDARARGNYTMGVQGGKLYVFAGRSKHDPADKRIAKVDFNEIHKLDFFRDCYMYSPKKELGKGEWKRVADLPFGLSAAPATAVPAGVSHLLMLGGVNVDFLRGLTNTEKYPTLDKNRHGFDHPGFPRTVWAYHSITDTWTKYGELPKGAQAPVTAPVVIDGKEFVIPSGEWSPKLRTTQVLSGVVYSEKLGFGIINWTVVLVYLGAMVGIGYWFMKRESASSTEAYFRGGQKIPWWVAGLSIFATMLSAITFMAIPGTAYATNWNGYIGQWPILIIVPLVVLCYLPFYRRLNITTAYEYLEKRFNVVSRVIASVTFMLFHIGRVAIVLYLPALALSSVTSINIFLAIAVIGILCVIYTVMGGIEAVVWTDAIQAMVLIGGALLCFGLVVAQVDGGIGTITAAMANESKGITASFDFSSLDISKASTSGVVLFIAFLFANLPSYTAGQDVVQRYVTTPSEKEAARSLWMNIVMVLVGSAIFFGLGTALYVFYKGQPAMLDPAMPAKDGILPFFIMQNLPVGVAGLIIAGVFAAAQSTISSSLNSVATAFVTDVYGRLIRPDSSDQMRLGVARNVVIGLGVIGILVSSFIAYTKVDSAFMLFNTFIGFALGPLGGLFALGIFNKRSGGVAGLMGLICGVITVVTVHFMKLDVMPLLYGCFGFMSTFIMGSILGLVFPAKKEEVDGLTLFTQKK